MLFMDLESVLKAGSRRSLRQEGEGGRGREEGMMLVAGACAAPPMINIGVRRATRRETSAPTLEEG